MFGDYHTIGRTCTSAGVGYTLKIAALGMCHCFWIIFSVGPNAFLHVICVDNRDVIFRVYRSPFPCSFPALPRFKGNLNRYDH